MGTETNNTQATTEQNTEKITFNEAQQARVNELIQEAMGRAGREARTELSTLKTQFDSLKSELDSAKATASKAKTPAQRQDADSDVESILAQMAEVKSAAAMKDAEVERLRQQLQAKDKEANDYKGKALEIQKTHAMVSAASKTNFINADIVTKLTADQVKYDESRGRFIVVSEAGTERMNSAFEPMSLEEFYAEFANKNPYLVRGDVKGGTGSSESQRSGLSNVGKYQVEQIFGRGSNAALANQLAKQDPKEYGRLRHEAKEKGLIAR